MTPENPFAFVAGSGLIGLGIFLAILACGFVLSAWLMSLYLRLVIHFSRRSLDREYRYMRGDYSSRSSSPATYVPRNW